MSSTPHPPEEPVDVIKEELDHERKRVQELLNELESLKQKYTSEVGQLKSRLASEQQLSSVLRKSFTMKTIEGLLTCPETDLDHALKEEIARLHQRLFELEAENYANAEKIKGQAVENTAIRDAMAKIAFEKEKITVQFEEACLNFEGICNENKALKTELNGIQTELKRNYDRIAKQVEQIDSLTRERETLLEEVKNLSSENQRISEGLKSQKVDQERLEEMVEAQNEENFNLRNELEQVYGKLKNEEKNASDLKDELAAKTEQIRDLKQNLLNIRSTIRNKDQNIQRLENEMTREAVDEQTTNEALKQAKKENALIKNELKIAKANLEANENNLEEMRKQLSNSINEHRMVQKEIAKKTAEIQGLLEELDVSRETTKELKDKINEMKEDFSRQMADRVISLKKEKLELEDKLNYLHDDTSDTKSFLDQPTLQDELSQLDDYRLARVSLLFNSFGDHKQMETLKAELAEKESLIQSLSMSNEELQKSLNKANKQVLKAKRQVADIEREKEIEIDRYRVLIRELQSSRKGQEDNELKAKVNELQAEVELLTTQMSDSAKCWADEKSKLIVSLRDAEFAAAEARVKHYQSNKEISALKQRLAEETSQPKGALSRFTSIFKRS